MKFAEVEIKVVNFSTEEIAIVGAEGEGSGEVPQ